MNMPKVGDKIRAKMSGREWTVLRISIERTWEGRRYENFIIDEGFYGYSVAISGDDLLKNWEVIEENS